MCVSAINLYSGVADSCDRWLPFCRVQPWKIRDCNSVWNECFKLSSSEQTEGESLLDCGSLEAHICVRALDIMIILNVYPYVAPEIFLSEGRQMKSTLDQKHRQRNLKVATLWEVKNHTLPTCQSTTPEMLHFSESVRAHARVCVCFNHPFTVP